MFSLLLHFLPVLLFNCVYMYYVNGLRGCTNIASYWCVQFYALHSPTLNKTVCMDLSWLSHFSCPILIVLSQNANKVLHWSLMRTNLYIQPFTSPEDKDKYSLPVYKAY